ncbi:MAG TPA: ABC transporter permease [Sphaerochaeta sp.]|nr:ABC transporter permease [Spirochaetota bacterium]NLV61545.1 ABC transporter permease [Spirochaetales bacterium]HOE83599.1 ABC transporter permease [Sphaerochaeta sp.]HOQ93793.1 ABC transporter permease [Sphaerochaeta sp.]HQB89919.1 ABC transporter permease [Sphaerochaeta sp.]
MNPVSRLLTLRKLGIGANRAARRRVIFNIVLITLVVSILVLAQIFVVSMSRGIADKWALLADGHLQLYVDKRQPMIEHPSIETIDRVGEVNALLYSPDKNQMVRVKGVEQSYFNDSRLAQLTITQSENASPSTLAKIMISTTLAERLAVKIDDRLALMLVSNDAIRAQLCIIGALYDTGYHELDEQLVFCDLDFLEHLFTSGVTVYYEVLTQERNLETVKGDFERAGYMATTWKEQNPALSGNLETSRQAVLAVMVAVAILCGYFISELSSQMVEDDKARIATLHLIGAQPQVVRRAYWTAVMVITTVSIALGTALGILFARQLPPLLATIAARSYSALSFYLLDFPIRVPVLDLSIIASVLFCVSAVSVHLSLRRVSAIDALSCVRFD